LLGGIPPPKSHKIFKTGMLGLDQISKIFISDGLDLSIFGINNLRTGNRNREQ